MCGLPGHPSVSGIFRPVVRGGRDVEHGPILDAIGGVAAPMVPKRGRGRAVICRAVQSPLPRIRNQIDAGLGDTIRWVGGVSDGVYCLLKTL